MNDDMNIDEDNSKQDLVESGVVLSGQYLSQDQDIEASLASTEDQAGLVEEDNVPHPGFVGSVEQDPRRRPGAYAIPGVFRSPSFATDEYSSQEETENVAPQPGVLWVAQSAQLVDEAAEEERRLELEHERQRNRELESRIHQIESDAVAAIPVVAEEDTDTQEPSPSNQDHNPPGFFQKKRTRRCLAGALLAAVFATIGIVIGIVLGIVFRNEDDDRKSLTTNPADFSWTQLGQPLTGKEAKDYFGYSVALSANGVVVAGSGIGNNGSLAGYVRVFSYEPGSQLWGQQGKDINGKEKGDEFGTIIALSQDGTVVAAGATTGLDRRAYVQVHSFNTDTEQWEQLGQDIEERTTGDDEFFGSSVAMSADGNVIAAGGPGHPYDDGGNHRGNQTGYVQVFSFNKAVSLWEQLGQDLNGDAFGRSLALSRDGRVVAVGADWSDGSGADNRGRVKVFLYRYNNRWNQIGQDLVGEGSQDFSGYALSISEGGTIIAVGALWNDGKGGPDSGHVRVFSYSLSSNRWIQIGQDIDGESADDQFGVSVALSADGLIVVAGAHFNDGKGGEKSGHVRVFSYDSNTDHWNQVGEDIDGERKDDQFGVSVSISADGAVVAGGSYLNDRNGVDSGQVRVFQAR